MSYSPRSPGSTPIHDWQAYDRMSSATPTPSPRPAWVDATPRRPVTRAAHSRVHSYSQQMPSMTSPRPHKDSPRYNSSGLYSTLDVSANHSSSRRPSGSFQRPSKPGRRYSYAYVRSSTPYGESDEDEFIEVLDRTYVLPAQSRSKGRRHEEFQEYDGDWFTNPGGFTQGVSYYDNQGYSQEYYKSPPPPRQQQPPPPTHRSATSHGHRRSSTAVPQRTQTVRPPANPAKAKPAQPRAATEDDAARHEIPAGYSLKNWDPNEEPILLLGSVFDANNLGKWIYDWTVFHKGPTTPIADMAGELWLLLIQLAGKVKRAEDTVGKVRIIENRETINEFIDAGERLMNKLRGVLKACEAPMLRTARASKSGALRQDAGVEFVKALFGREQELHKTEKFMQSVRLFNLRFDANCDDILRNPTL